MKISFVLGAGASSDFGYPLGDGLKQHILKNINLGRNATSAYLALLNQAENDPRVIGELIDFLPYAERDTIDAFIRGHKNRPDLQRVARQAIGLSIASSETNNKLFNVGVHWYQRLLTFFRDNPAELDRERFRFFTFNYDRSLEYYLRKSLISGGSDFTGEQIDSFFTKNPFHLHGSVGPLPWQGSDSKIPSREYSGQVSVEMVKAFADQIVTPDQKIEDTEPVRDHLLNSDLVVFMGFGFAPSNRDKIFFHDLVNKGVRMLASTNGRDDLAQFLAPHKTVKCYSMDCNNFIAQFIRDFEKGLLG